MSAYSDKVIADGAVAYWRLGESSGTVAHSEIGSFDGTISGGVTLNQPGALTDGNTAMLFDGSTGAIGAPGPSPTIAVTLEAWIKPLTVGLLQIRGIVIKGQGGVAFSWGVILDNGRIGYRWNNGDYVAVAATPSPNVWTHVVLVADETATPPIAVYLDGARYAGGFSGVLPSGDFVLVAAPPVSIGRNLTSVGGTDAVFAGSLDEIAIYSIALTPAQIAAHYTLGSGPTPAQRRRRRFRAHAC